MNLGFMAWGEGGTLFCEKGNEEAGNLAEPGFLLLVFALEHRDCFLRTLCNPVDFFNQIVTASNA